MAKRLTPLSVRKIAPSESDIMVRARCDTCNGSGVYQGFAEKKGEAVVCEACEGEGCHTITYTPFAGRTTVKGVEKVYWSAGTSLLGCGPIGNPVTYREFLAGKMPKRPPRSPRSRRT